MMVNFYDEDNEEIRARLVVSHAVSSHYLLWGHSWHIEWSDGTMCGRYKCGRAR